MSKLKKKLTKIGILLNIKKTNWTK